MEICAAIDANAKISAILPGTVVRNHCRCVSSLIQAVPDAGLISGAIEKPPTLARRLRHRDREEETTTRMRAPGRINSAGSDGREVSGESHPDKLRDCGETFLAHSGQGYHRAEPEKLDAALVSYFDDKFLEEKGDGGTIRDTLLRPTRREVLASRRASLERLHP